jgi:hypothetical protein
MSLFVLRSLAGFSELRRFVALKTVSFWRKLPKQNQDESQQIFRYDDRELSHLRVSFYDGRTFLQSSKLVCVYLDVSPPPATDGTRRDRT